ncbi:MAG: uracil-DNA glycosylase [Thermoguttaceae bacterium]|jgi:DNA polymerase
MDADRTRKALAQRLESLRQAGVTHVPRAGDCPSFRSTKTGLSPSAPPPSAAPQELPIAFPRGGDETIDGPPQPQPPAETAEPVVDRAAALALVAQRVAACQRCAELARTRTQTVFGTGNPHARLVFLGEAPGADEDRLGQPFVGRAGQLLTDIIVKGMKLRREDVYIMNILRCRPPSNRAPLPVEAAACREYLDAQLSIIQPEFICCLGAVAAQNLLGTDTAIGRLRGRIHDFHGIRVLCTYHPAYLLRNPDAKRFVWDDIKILMKEMGL